jgi:hypothetical protein
MRAAGSSGVARAARAAPRRAASSSCAAPRPPQAAGGAAAPALPSRCSCAACGRRRARGAALAALAAVAAAGGGAPAAPAARRRVAARAASVGGAGGDKDAFGRGGGDSRNEPVSSGWDQMPDPWQIAGARDVVPRPPPPPPPRPPPRRGGRGRANLGRTDWNWDRPGQNWDPNEGLTPEERRALAEDYDTQLAQERAGQDPPRDKWLTPLLDWQVGRGARRGACGGAAAGLAYVGLWGRARACR